MIGLKDFKILLDVCTQLLPCTGTVRIRALLGSVNWSSSLEREVPYNIELSPVRQAMKLAFSGSAWLSHCCLRRVDYGGRAFLAQTCEHQLEGGYFLINHLPPQQLDESDRQRCKTPTDFRSLIDNALPRLEHALLKHFDRLR